MTADIQPGVTMIAAERRTLTQPSTTTYYYVRTVLTVYLRTPKCHFSDLKQMVFLNFASYDIHTVGILAFTNVDTQEGKRDVISSLLFSAVLL